MADSSDVETALVGCVLNAITTVSGTSAARVYRGSPQAVLLDHDLATGIPHVTVVATDTAHNTTRYINQPLTVSAKLPGLTATLFDGGIVFGGVGGAGQVVGTVVAGISTAYRLTASDTPASVAAAVSGQLGGTVAPPTTVLIADATWVRVVADQTCQQEARREEREFRITAWCPAPDIRDLIIGAIDGAIGVATFLPLADGSLARVRATGDGVIDRADVADLWRRDLIVTAEFAVIATQTLPEMLFGSAQVLFGAGATLELGAVVGSAS